VLKRFIWWDYPRGSWQYDVMVGVILAFIFLTPREWFRDQPRIPTASSIAMLPTEKGSLEFFVNPELLVGIAESQRAAKLNEVLRKRTSNYHLAVTRVEAVLNEEGELQGYMAFARP